MHQSNVVIRRGRYRRAVPDEVSSTAVTSPMAPTSPRIAARLRRSPTSATGHRPTPAARARHTNPPRDHDSRRPHANAGVHRLRQGDGALHAELEHRHDLSQQATASNDPSTGSGAVGFANVGDRIERRRHERERDHHHQPDLIERARCALDQLRVRDHRVERAEGGHDAHDGEAFDE
jgi:hypothetical protein